MHEYEFFLTDMLEKVFPGRRPRALTDDYNIPVCGGEIPAIQLVYTRRKEKETKLSEDPVSISITGCPAAPVLCSVELVPADFPAYEDADEGYVTTEPGLFPDLLMPLNANKIYPLPGQYRAVWIDFPGITAAKHGTYRITITLTAGGYNKTLCFSMTVLPISLKPPKLIHTEWFHADCLASYYHVTPLSEEHWTIIEEFIKPMSIRYGINTLLTPVFTPPLDTDFGGERPTIQLVDIEVTADSYRFTFAQLERWCALCRKYNISYLEIPHFFTQWGAQAAPKIMAAENGVQKRIFGWDTEASDPAYRRFLECFIPALRARLKEYGYDESHVFFHISDEPPIEYLEDYKRAKGSVSDLVLGSVITDAVSNITFWQQNIVEHPIAANNHIMPFIEAGADNLWTYYCCAQYKDVPNRFFSMPSERNRIMGILIYLYNIKGFLHWGYNYYYSRYSKELIDPYFDTSARHSFPAGDPYLVYPGSGGRPLPSIRGEVLRQAFEDIRILELIEERHGRQMPVELVLDTFGEKITFEHYPSGPECFFTFREKAASILNAGGTQINSILQGV
jgi:hypothetical protein